MIAETIKLLQSGTWCGCSETIEIAKGKNAIPKTWAQAKEKMNRRKFMEAEKGRKKARKQWENIVSKCKKIWAWLFAKK